ncbi:MAG TPA: DUF4199 domain-containing protein [Bacteroidales bacterium]|nr:DUF4199 domain-containing protein [Lentimicrobiaceae bacterium]HOI00573.1 DUF4199 domain-containing protein [Bacteroidales bacterium]
MNEVQETRATSVWPTAIRHGLITGGLLILFTLLIYALGMMQNKALGFVSILLLIGGMYIGTKNYRDHVLGGFMTYGKAFTTAFFIGLVASVLLSVYTYFFYTFFDPGMIDVIVEQAEETMLQRNPELTDEQLDMALTMTRKMTQPGWLAGMGIITNGIASLIIGLILGIFLKKEDPFASQL